MTDRLPMRDPSSGSSLADRTLAYVRANLLLRTLVLVTAADHLLAILLVVTGRLHGEVAGVLVLFSVLSWFFAVLLPVMNRELAARSGAPSALHWGDRAAVFFRFLLCVVTLFYTAVLARVALGV